MRAALKIFGGVVLIFLLVPLAYCQNGENHEDTDSPDCDNHYPYFSVRVGGYQAVIRYQILDQIKITYGTPLRMECSGADAAELTITKNGVKLQTKNWSKTTISWWTRKPDIETSQYLCVDTATNCTRSASVTVTPALEVISPDFEVGTREYIINYGKSLSVTCSGPATRLNMTKNGIIIPTVNADATKIKWFVNKPDLQISEIACTDVNTFINSSVVVKVVPHMYIRKNETTMTEFVAGFTQRHFWYSTYSDSIEVICTGPRAIKIINPEEDKNEVLAQSVNKSIVNFFTKTLQLGESVFRCVDSEVSEYRTSVHVMVIPRMDVTSPNVRKTEKKYVVKRGDPIEITCTGPDAKELLIEDNNGEMNEKIHTVNETTVKWYINKAKMDVVYKYYCYVGEAASQVVVVVEEFPKTVGFSCISYNLQYLNCSWIALNDRISFALFNTENDTHTRICTREPSRERSKFCVWHGTDNPSYSRDEKKFSFLMESCNELGCFNQTFLIDHLSVLKLAPIKKLSARSSSPRSVDLLWSLSSLDYRGDRFWSDSDFHHKVEYWYSGIQPVEVNSSLVSCSLFEHCRIKLELPCPGEFYKVWVYQKLKKAVGEEFWSDPVSVTFHTVYSRPDIVDPPCYQNPRENPEVLKYFINKLRHEVRAEMPQIRKEVSSLHDKRARIRLYLAEQSQINEKSSLSP